MGNIIRFTIDTKGKIDDIKYFKPENYNQNIALQKKILTGCQKSSFYIVIIILIINNLNGFSKPIYSINFINGHRFYTRKILEVL